MNRFKFLAGAAAITCLIDGPAAALAASNTDVQSVQSTKLSLSDAIFTAQKQTRGRAIFAKYETVDGASNYIVTVVMPGGNKDTVAIDPQTGQMTKQAQGNSGSSSEAGARTIAQARIGLAKAIKTAEATQGGKAMRITLDTTKGKTAYKVDMAMGDRTMTAWIDANSGIVLSAFYERPLTGAPPLLTH